MNYVLVSLLALLVLTGTSYVNGTNNKHSICKYRNEQCTEDPDAEDCNPQPDRVGNDDDPSTDADRDGPGGDDGAGQETDDDSGDSNCWGQVSKGLAQKDDGKAGLGEHSSDPVQSPGDTDNETPREGVGNQAEGHPSDHADQVGGLVDNDETPDVDETPDCVD